MTGVWVACVVFWCGVMVSLAAAPPPSALRIIREKCLSCHSGDKSPNGLKLDTVDNMVRGGKSGPALVPYKPDDSLMFKAITGTVQRMPPFYPLEESQVAIIRRWIYMGAQQTSMGSQEP